MKIEFELSKKEIKKCYIIFIKHCKNFKMLECWYSFKNKY